jgi:two-component system, cell cycle response regulator
MVNPENVIRIINNLLQHYYSLFPFDEVKNVFIKSGIVLNEQTGLLRGYNSSIPDLLNHFCETIAARKGFSWLALIENELLKLTGEYQIKYPDIYNSSIYALEKKCESLEKEKNVIIDQLHIIEMKLEEKVFKDPLAQVYKEDMFKENLISDISAFRDIGIDFAFFIIEIDNLPSLNIKYGRDAGDELLANTAYLLKNFKKNNKQHAHHLIFRMNGPRFTYYCNDLTRDEIISIAEEVRTEFRESALFITNITVSIGVVHSGEFSVRDKEPSVLFTSIFDVANSRLRLAKHRGTDSVCSESEMSASFDDENYVMIIDPDISIRYMLETHLLRAGFKVDSYPMGDEALEKIDIKKPMAIISGLTLPKIDGFSLRKKLLEDSSLKDIPFILTSATKDETSIIRAQSLGIYHYFKKPYSIIELIGLVKNMSETVN